MILAAQPGPDGRLRCPWALGAPEYLDYHDYEWGVPVTGVSGLFERLSLEAFQSGLSWITILRKREAFRAAFSSFEPERVAEFDETDVARLVADPAIMRNRAKIAATVANARWWSGWARSLPDRPALRRAGPSAADRDGRPWASSLGSVAMAEELKAAASGSSARPPRTR